MMEFVFEETLWQKTLDAWCPGEHMTALRFLSLTEDMDDDEVEEAFAELEEKQIALDLSDLPANLGSGKMALRLRQEQQLVRQKNLVSGLEETDPLRLYLEELAAIPAAGDVQVIAQEYAAGNTEKMQQLTDLSLCRCVELAQELTGHGVLLLDLIQEAGLGLWQGILSYTGGDFEKHRDWWIRQYLAKAVILQARSSDVGQKLRQGMEDYRDVDQRLLGELGRNPTLEEIAEAMHVSVDDASVFADMVSAARNRRQIDEEREEKEPSPDEEQAVEDTAYFQSRQRILEMLSTLTQQEAKLLTLRFGLEGGVPLTPEQAGLKLNMTPQEVVQMEAQALSKLRKED